MSTDDKSDDRYTVPALARGLQLLTQFSREERELSGAELSRRLGLPRASVFRMLYTLEQGGFVERADDGVSYRLGLAVLRLGFELLAAMDLTEHGRPVIEALRDQCGYSAHIVVRDATQVVFVAKAAGRSALFQSIQVGARLPAHATVLGRLLMADLDAQALKALYPDEPLQAFTPRTPTSRAQLKALIEEDRARGYGVSMGGFETGISTVAAPVINARGAVIAAISIAVPAQRIDDAVLPGLVEQVRAAAGQLSDRIRHAPTSGSEHPKIRMNS
ncbi:MAG: IclR family transcriptional regulator [Limnohabitans sp.]|nr:IclR family transcriptional regulator [Limnohabitans sp.]